MLALSDQCPSWRMFKIIGESLAPVSSSIAFQRAVESSILGNHAFKWEDTPRFSRSCLADLASAFGWLRWWARMSPSSLNVQFDESNKTSSSSASASAAAIFLFHLICLSWIHPLLTSGLMTYFQRCAWTCGWSSDYSGMNEMKLDIPSIMPCLLTAFSWTSSSR